MDVLRANSDAADVVDRKRFCIDRYELLLVVSGADHAISSDAWAEEHDGVDRPMIFAIAIVVVWRAAHFALDDNNQLFTNLKLLRFSQ